VARIPFVGAVESEVHRRGVWRRAASASLTKSAGRPETGALFPIEAQPKAHPAVLGVGLHVGGRSRHSVGASATGSAVGRERTKRAFDASIRAADAVELRPHLTTRCR